jgi:hypothetical protein
MGYKKVRAASPLRRSRFLVCLAPSPTYLGRIFWCAFEPLAPRLGKKMQPARFVFKPKPELPFRPVGPSVGEVVRSTPLRAPGLVLAAHGVGWRALRVLPRLVFWPHCVY